MKNEQLDVSPPAPGEEGLRRVIGKLGYGTIVLNGVIGAGIFGLPAAVAAQAGAFSPWLFVICAVMILTIVLSFAQAASYVRGTGGPIVYARLAFGHFVGFQAGWLLWVSRLAAMAANVVLLVSYAGFFWPALDGGWPRALALTGVMVTMTVLNVVGVRAGMAALYVLTVLKLLPLVLLVLVGLPRIELAPVLGAGWPPMDTFGDTVLMLLYAYVGFEAAVIPAGEGRNPRRDIPKALVGTVVGITVLYVLVQLVTQSVLPGLAGSERPLADAAAVLFGSFGATLLVAGAVISIAGNGSASMLGAPRLTFALAQDGHLPAWFGRIHPRFATPANSIVFYGVAALALALTGSFIWLAVMSTLVRLLTYAVCILSLPRLRQRGKAREDAVFRLPGGYLVPAVALALCAWLVTHASLESWLATGAFAALGTVLYFVSVRRPRRGS